VHVAIAHEGLASSVPALDGMPHIPSVIAEARGRTVVGAPARAHFFVAPNEVLFSPARHLGGGPVKLGEGRQEPEALVAALLAQALAAGLAAARGSLDGVALSRAAWASPEARRALAEAAQRAGMHVVRSEVSTTLAAIARQIERGGAGIMAFVDVGGWKVEATVVAFEPGEVRALGRSVDATIGANWLDGRLVKALVHQVAPDHERKLLRDKLCYGMLREHCENMRIDLSANPSAVVSLPFLGPMIGLREPPVWRLDRDFLEVLAEPLFEAIRVICAEALEHAGVGPSQVEEACVVGGLAHMAAVRETVGAAFNLPMSGRGDPDGVVARGAALAAAASVGQLKLRIVDELDDRGRSVAAAGWGRPIPPSETPAPEPILPDPSQRPRRPSSSERPVPRPMPAGPSDEARAAPLPAHGAPAASAKLDVSGPDANAAGSRLRVAAARLTSSQARSPVPATRTSAPPPLPSPSPFPVESPVGVQPEAPPAPPDAPAEPAPSPASEQSLPPEGSFRNPLTAMGLAAIPLDGKLQVGPGLSLPVLLLVIGRCRGFSGHLRLKRDKQEACVAIVRGGVAGSSLDLEQLRRAFEWPEGRYKLTGEAPSSRLVAARQPMVKVVMHGVRSAMRVLDVRQIVDVLQPHLNVAPILLPSRAALVPLLGLSPRELRFVEHTLDGTTSTDEILRRGGIGRETAVQLLFVLQLFRALEWRSVEERPGESPADRLRQRARKLEKADHFEALGVHWSVSRTEIERALRHAEEELRPGGKASQLDPEAAAAILTRVRAAYQAVAKASDRHAYLLAIHPDLDFEAIESVAEDQSQWYAWRGAAEATQESARLKHELSELSRMQHDPTKGGT